MKKIRIQTLSEHYTQSSLANYGSRNNKYSTVKINKHYFVWNTIFYSLSKLWSNLFVEKYLNIVELYCISERHTSPLAYKCIKRLTWFCKTAASTSAYANIVDYIQCIVYKFRSSLPIEAQFTSVDSLPV